MKTHELLEGWRPRGWKGTYYQLPYNHPTRTDRGFERMFNFVLPGTAELLGVPRRNLDYDGFTTEKGSVIVKVSSSKTEVDMLQLMLPKALKAKLIEAGFERVHASDAFLRSTKPTPKGTIFTQVVCAMVTEFPQKWIDWDKQRYGQSSV